MVNFLNARDIAHTQETVPATSLKPTQAEYSPEKVDAATARTGEDRSILVSSDNHVVDGHHQWVSKLSQGGDINVIRLHAPAKDLLPVVREFPSATTAQGALDGSQSTSGQLDRTAAAGDTGAGLTANGAGNTLAATGNVDQSIQPAGTTALSGAGEDGLFSERVKLAGNAPKGIAKIALDNLSARV
jgi:hypothetical protein